MGFELPNGKTARNLQEQVKFLSEKLKELYAAVNKIGIRVKIVEELPEEGEPATIYFVPAEDASEENMYYEYMWIEDKWEFIGKTQLDLSGYVDLASAQTITGTKSFALSDSQEYKGVITPLSSGFKLGTNVIDSLRFAGYGMYAMSKFIPEDNGTLDLGQSDLKWKDLYLSNAVYFGSKWSALPTSSDNILTLQYTGVNYYNLSNTDFCPRVADIELGTSGSPWGNFYLSGTIFQTNYNISWDNGILIKNSSNATMFYIGSDKSCWVYGKIIPSGGNVDIGDGGHKIRNMYISNNITDGTNSVSVADLAALITYAKGQGWIS